ncbi:PP2C family serine/threonine-protein phosphatase [Kamptonema formosum]|uniref:PP2C family serine/threonine-protein phosphatase n=1 Tax=Kamptonema formosum TaxID=331992 RepID=UPI000346E8D3|nr:protein phosphatase 2C domain-containing protein [Oscillatoria sp. PCC 10802]
MQHNVAKINCSNPTCQAPNPESNRFCEKCRTPLPVRYLWAIGAGAAACKPGEILADRYWVKRDRILLDTKPGLAPAMPEEIPPELAPYLRLFPYRLHVPQVYGHLPRPVRQTKDIWLLEGAPIAAESSPKAAATNPNAPVAAQLRPQLDSAWKEATAMRQLNWLWQIAQLWQPCHTEGVASSLLNPKLLHAEGQIVRLLELEPDRQPRSLSELGHLWSKWVPQAKPQILPFLEKLCQLLVEGRLHPEKLVDLLDEALAVCGQTQERTCQIATLSDTGPMRRRNEDACYPDSGAFLTLKSTSEVLTIVCDGIGGHEGGNVASATAIETIQNRVGNLQSRQAGLTPQTLIEELEQSARAANDSISDRNNEEQRQGRQRMGTTLVMAVARAHEIYITHVGDSRAYWISRPGCYQVTLDDDVASREVRLGYALYRDAVQQPAAGSLVQALGMGASNMLHPTAQRFVVDEDCIFLLCSDGLSDNDRVEQSWESEILPVLGDTRDLHTCAKKLVDIGNSENGHDNVTVALLYCQVRENSSAEVSFQSLLAELDAVPPPAPGSDPTAQTAPTLIQPPHPGSSRGRTLMVSRPLTGASPLPILLLIALLLGVGVPALAYFFIPEFKEKIVPDLKEKISSLISRTGNSSSEQGSTGTPAPATPSASASPASLASGSLIRIANPPAENAQVKSDPVVLFSKAEEQEVVGTVPAGSVLQVLRKHETLKWVKLKVCWTPDGAGRPASAPEENNPVSPKKNSPDKPAQAPVGKPTTPTPRTAPPLGRSATATLETPASQSPAPPPVRPGDTGWVLEEKLLPVAVEIPDRELVPEGACSDPAQDGGAPATTQPAPAESPQ